MSCPDDATIEPSRMLAIRHAITHAQAGDLVLVAGKGHETWQIVGDLKLPFSDQEHVHLALEAL
jgi:UDP-N-acetylmuramoyl-L-alanyl-D-glutamate--2,6-diaminopimelate ligase